MQFKLIEKLKQIVNFNVASEWRRIVEAGYTQRRRQGRSSPSQHSFYDRIFRWISGKPDDCERSSLEALLEIDFAAFEKQ